MEKFLNICRHILHNPKSAKLTKTELSYNVAFALDKVINY